VLVNKYGMATVFVFNVLPLPAQPLATVLGVFKYNKAKFYLAFILGQGIKFSAIALAYFYIL
jgi:membrane protein YqaA with SNARE-associated domain